MVLKFGGSSFRDLTDYGRIADYLAHRVRDLHRPLAVVVSAMPGETEGLRERLTEVHPHPAEENVAGLLTLADTVSAQLLTAALDRRGLRAAVLVGHQLGLTTEGSPMWATLTGIDPAPLREAMAGADVLVVPGGQAVDTAGRPSWLGKNSSDLTAVAVAAALGATDCEIFSDVDGVYDCDPHLVPASTLLPELSYRDAGRLSAYGAKVLHRRAVALAEEHRITLVCRGNRGPYPVGTVIAGTGAPAAVVVLNRRSGALLHPTADRAAETAALLNGAGIEAFAAATAQGPCVVVAGGYVDLAATGTRLGLPEGRPGGVPVVTVRGDSAEVRLAADETAAVELARQLHAELTSTHPQGVERP
ncbi:aspartate kinase [Kitasatospora sp. NPDC051853]|uniref:amino acid kinase family protein n=1 Tax=Kitasatospora sp. NPDC051853 TaxID=3364058 RepID=UPI0037B834E3